MGLNNLCTLLYEIKKKIYMNGRIVIFRLPPKTKNVELCKFVQRFYGQDTRTGKYRYRRHGLLDDIPYRKLLRGVIIIDPKDLEPVLTAKIQRRGSCAKNQACRRGSPSSEAIAKIILSQSKAIRNI